MARGTPCSNPSPQAPCRAAYMLRVLPSPFKSIARAAVLSALSMAIFTGALAGCTKGGDESGAASAAKAASSPAESAPGAVLPRTGKPLFRFDYETVPELLIVKADPGTGDAWSARLRRPDLADPRSPEWEIVSDPADHALLDRRADAYFILHLLDTLRTLQVAQTEVPGPETSLGLAPPRFALQWRASAGGSPEFELRVGAPAREPSHVFARVPAQPPFTMNGATLEMLDRLTSFESLRLRTWAGLAADDVDEIELRRGGKPFFYAQREGAEWTDRSRKPVRGDVDEWLEAVTHARILAFVDDAAKAGRLRRMIDARPEREALFKDRRGKETRLALGRGPDGKLYATSSARPKGVFEAYPVALRALDAPK